MASKKDRGGESSFNTLATRNTAAFKNITKRLTSDPKLGTGNMASSPGGITTELMRVVKRTVNRRRDAENAFNAIPELEMVAQVSLSTILTASDEMLKTTLNYRSEAKGIPFELNEKLLKLVRGEIDERYQLPTKLYDMLYEALFKTGSYPIVIVPETELDELFNQGKIGQESLSTLLAPRGFLGPIDTDKTQSTGLESFTEMLKTPQGTNPDSLKITNFYGSNITLSDNSDILKLPKLKKALLSARMASSYNVGAESMGENVDGTAGFLGMASEVSKDNQKRNKSKRDGQIIDKSRYATDQVIALASRPANLKSSSAGVEIHCTSESVVNVYVPGNVRERIGAFVLLDRNGNTIDMNDPLNFQQYNILSEDANSTNLKQVANNLGMGSDYGAGDDWTAAKLAEMHSTMLDEKIRSSLENGYFGEALNFTLPEQVGRVMLSRVLAKKQTQMLFVPDDQLVYYALDYDRFGSGRSLTDKSRVYISAKAALTYATMQASMLNATRNLQYNIKLDPNDRDPENTIDRAKDRVMRSHNNRSPYYGNLSDIDSYLQNAGISFSIEGNDNYPSLEVAMSDNTPDYKVPDRDVVENVDKVLYRGFGIDPDLIITSSAVEFATQSLSKDLLATKQAVKRQERINPIISKHVRLHIRANGPLIQEMADIVVKFYGERSKRITVKNLEDLIGSFIDWLRVELPEPSLTSLATKLDAWDTEERAMNIALDAMFDDDIFDGLEVDVRNLRALMKLRMTKDWLISAGVNNRYIELFETTEGRTELINMLMRDFREYGETFARLTKATKRSSESLTKRYLTEPDGEEEDGNTDDNSAEDDNDVYGEDIEEPEDGDSTEETEEPNEKDENAEAGEPDAEAGDDVGF